MVILLPLVLSPDNILPPLLTIPFPLLPAPTASLPNSIIPPLNGLDMKFLRLPQQSNTIIRAPKNRAHLAITIVGGELFKGKLVVCYVICVDEGLEVVRALGLEQGLAGWGG